jgi:hypothetical protein
VLDGTREIHMPNSKSLGIGALAGVLIALLLGLGGTNLYLTATSSGTGTDVNSVSYADQ